MVQAVTARGPGCNRIWQASLAFFDVTEEDPSALEAWASLGVCMEALGQVRVRVRVRVRGRGRVRVRGRVRARVRIPRPSRPGRR